MNAFRTVATILCLGCLASSASAVEVRYRIDMTPEQAQFYFDTMAKKGWHYRHLDTVTTPAGVRYTMIFADEKQPRFLGKAGLSAKDFQAAFDAAAADNMRLTDIATADGKGGGIFGGIWEDNDGRDWETRSGLTIAQFVALFNEATGNGMRLTDIACYQSDGALYYAGTFQKIEGPAWYGFADMTPQQSQIKFDEMVKQGFRQVGVTVCNTPSGPHVSEIFEKSDGRAWISKAGLDKNQFATEAAADEKAGMSLLDLSAYFDGDQVRYAAIWSK